MSTLVYTCDACDDARRHPNWLDGHEQRELVRLAYASPDAVTLTSLCSHAVRVESGAVVWLGPRAVWLDGLVRFAPKARPVPTTVTELYSDPAWQDATQLRRLAAMPQERLTFERPDGVLARLNLLVVSGDGLRWIGYRDRWAAARLPHLRSALSRAS